MCRAREVPLFGTKDWNALEQISWNKFRNKVLYYHRVILSVARVLKRERVRKRKYATGNILKGNQCSLAAAVRH